MLTELKIKKLSTQSGLLADGLAKGLYYKASGPAVGKWVFRYVSPETKKRRDMGLGTYPEVSLADARHSAIAQRSLIASGVDPIEAKRSQEQERAARAAESTFEDAARLVFADISGSFRNAKHKAQWLSSLDEYVFPILGHRKVSSLRAQDFADALRPIWLEKAETASRIKQRCGVIMDWCVAKGIITASPVSVVTKLLPRQPGKAERVQHQPAVPWQELPHAVTTLCRGNSRSPARRALEFLILTAARSGEVRGMEWAEVDFATKVWTIPASRMKAKTAHRVPLSDRAIEILKAQSSPRLHEDLVFPSGKGTQLSDMSLTKLLRDHRIKSNEPGRIATAHGFRSTFRDWASENGYARDLAEKALAHTIKNRTEAAYHRTDLLEQRRPMMEAWSEFVTGYSKNTEMRNANS